MSKSNDREERIFADALAIPEGERQRFIDDACEGNDDLRRRVEALIRAHDSAGGFMAGQPIAETESIFGEVPPIPVMSEDSGDWIGRYKLLQKLGEGGCGVVWMAEQEEPVRRRVAVKIIKLGMDTNQVIARFEAERQALAMMDHPNIAKILDAGATETGRPFFVMELVRGIRITDFCDQNNLSMNRRLELFSQVCHAVQHAHQKGIIHRDLKPSNILVTLHDGVPVPKVIDFGIAKATEGRLTDRTLFTAFEQFIGTPAYMSPEQAEMSGIDIDTRSDIYSLGVLLYELLTGRPPFDPKSLVRAGLDEIRRIIREVEPPKPSLNLSTLTDADRAVIARLRGTDPARLSVLLRGDLDWIVMRCLEKNRARRYETPTALAADIAHHLNNEPVVARPPSSLYRMSRLVRRNRLACAAIASVALAILAGTVISTWQAVRATRAERLATLERAKAVHERARAEDLLNFMLGDLRAQLEKVGKIEVLEAVVNKAAQFSSLSPDDLNDTDQASYAKGLILRGEIRISQARYGEAAAAFSEAYDRTAALAVRHPNDPEMIFGRGQAEYYSGLVHWRRGEVAAAEEWFTRYLDTSAALVALDPTQASRQKELAFAHHNIGVIHDEMGEPEKARSDFEAELATLEKMIAAAPGDPDLRMMQADADLGLGSVAERQGDLTEALREYSIQAKLFESTAESDAGDVERRRDQANALLYQVDIEMVTGQYPAARELLRKAQGLLDALVAHDDSNLLWRATNLNARLKAAMLARRFGEVQDAGREVDEVLSQLEALRATEPTDRKIAVRLATAWRLKAQIEYSAGQPAAAASATQAVKIGEELLAEGLAEDAETGEFARAYVVSGEIAAKAGNAADSSRDWQRATDLLGSRALGSRNWRLLDPAARVDAFMGRDGEARAIIAQLDRFGYHPLDPWPDLDRPSASKSSEPQSK